MTQLLHVPLIFKDAILDGSLQQVIIPRTTYYKPDTPITIMGGTCRPFSHKIRTYTCTGCEPLYISGHRRDLYVVGAGKTLSKKQTAQLADECGFASLASFGEFMLEMYTLPLQAYLVSWS
jgi:hypothetical protein